MFRVDGSHNCGSPKLAHTSILPLYSGDTLYARCWCMRNSYPWRAKPSDSPQGDAPLTSTATTRLNTPRFDGEKDSVIRSDAEKEKEKEREREKEKEKEKDKEKEKSRGTGTGVGVGSGTVISGPRSRTPSMDFPGLKGTEKLSSGVKDRGDDAVLVPCWILINLVHNTVPEGDVPSGTATTSMKVTDT